MPGVTIACPGILGHEGESADYRVLAKLFNMRRVGKYHYIEHLFGEIRLYLC